MRFRRIEPTMQNKLPKPKSAELTADQHSSTTPSHRREILVSRAMHPRGADLEIIRST
jgi:hypothetical protein